MDGFSYLPGPGVFGIWINSLRSALDRNEELVFFTMNLGLYAPGPGVPLSFGARGVDGMVNDGLELRILAS